MIRLQKILFKVTNILPHQKTIDQVGIRCKNIIFNPTVPQLYELAFLNQKPSDPYTKTSLVSRDGAMCAFSGRKTGREPQNSRVVKDQETAKTVDWGKYNIPIDGNSYDLIQNLAVDYINHDNKTFVIDGYAGWDPKHRIKVRTYCTRTYHALFMRNMLVRPTDKEYEEDFSKGVDVTIFNAGEMEVSKNIPGITSNMITILNLSQKRMVILGTQFAGEMKKSVFKILQYYYPRKHILTLHAASTQNSDGTTTIMCGLSGTGKTALGLRSSTRKMISDDETCWSDEGIFNIEGGSYAKIIGLDKDVQPQIASSIRFGAIVQNASFYQNTRTINYNDSSITPNARAAFPYSFLKNFKSSGMGSHPTNIIFLTCDTKGVLPPAAKINHEQAYYQFLSGYTAKIGGTESSSRVTESTFSACFGEIFLPLHPTIYAKMFYNKIKKHNSNVWLVNTGWTGGKYGVGKRIQFQTSQKIIDAINDGKLNNVETTNLQYFNFQIPTQIDGVTEDIIKPDSGWNSKVEYDQTLSTLAVEFMQNFDKKFKGSLEDFEQVKKYGPTI